MPYKHHHLLYVQKDHVTILFQNQIHYQLVDINEEFTQEQVVDEKSLDEAILKIVERTYGKKSERILLVLLLAFN